MGKSLQLLFLLCLICFFRVNGQLSDLARVDYTIIPDNNADDVEFSRFRALFNYPVKLKKEGEFLLLGLDYSNVNLRLRLRDETLPFDRESLSDFKIFDINIGFTKPIKNDWRLGIQFKPGFSTNLAANQLRFDDVVLSGTDGFKKTRLIVGATYSENRGFPFPLPFISYYKKFHPNWSFNIGIPKSNLQYHLSSKHRFKLDVSLDGFTSKIQDGVLLDTGDTAEIINMSTILGGLQYEFHFAKHLEFFARSSYIFSNATRLRDDNRDNIFSIDNESRFYIRTGIRFKI